VGVGLKLGGNPAGAWGEVNEHLSGSLAGSTWRSIWEEGHGGWEIHQIEGIPLEGTESAYVSGGPVQMRFEFLGTEFEYSCTGAGAEKATLASGGTESLVGFYLSGCTLPGLGGCTVPGGKVTFEPINATAGPTYETFVPAEGVFFATQFSGEECSFAGLTWHVGGSFTGVGSDFGSPHISQPLEFTGASSLTMPSGSGRMTGSMDQALSGALAGESWGVY